MFAAPPQADLHSCGADTPGMETICAPADSLAKIEQQNLRTLQVLKPVCKVCILPLMLVVPVVRDLQMLAHVSAQVATQVAAALCQR